MIMLKKLLSLTFLAALIPFTVMAKEEIIEAPKLYKIDTSGIQNYEGRFTVPAKNPYIVLAREYLIESSRKLHSQAASHADLINSVTPPPPATKVATVDFRLKKAIFTWKGKDSGRKYKSFELTLDSLDPKQVTRLSDFIGEMAKESYLLVQRVPLKSDFADTTIVHEKLLFGLFGPN